MFQGVRPGSVLHILQKGEDEPVLKTGQVVSVSNPYAVSPAQNLFGQQNTVVDIKVRIDGEVTTLKELPSLDTFTQGKDGTIVADNPEALLAEVENRMRDSRQVVESAPMHQHLLEVYEGFINVLNPKLAKQKEQEQEIAMLKQEMNGMKGTLTDIHNILLSLKSNEPK